MESGTFFLGLGAIILFLYLLSTLSNMKWFIQWLLRFNPRNADLHIALGNWLEEVEEFEEAEKEYRLAIQLKPKSRHGYYRLHLLQTKTLKREDAENTIIKLMKLFPEDSVAYSWKADLLATHDVVQAEENYIKSIELAPQSSFAFARYGRFLTGQNRLDDALEILRDAVTLHPIQLIAYLQLAFTLERLGKSNEAEKNYRKYLTLAPHDVEGYIYYSKFLFQTNRSKEAVRVIQKGVKKHPENAIAQAYLGVFLHAGGKRLDEAERAYRKAIELDPSDSTNFINLGNLLTILKRNDEAETVFRDAIRRFPGEHRVLHAAVIFLRNTNQNDGALSLLYRALESDPDYAGTKVGIASVLRSLGRLDESKELAEQVVKIIPEDDAYWYNQACVQAILGNNDISFEYLKKATGEKDFNINWAWEDPDLQWLRDDPRFAEIVGKKPE